MYSVVAALLVLPGPLPPYEALTFEHLHAPPTARPKLWQFVPVDCGRAEYARQQAAERCRNVLYLRQSRAAAVSDRQLISAIDGLNSCRDEKAVDLLIEFLPFEYDRWAGREFFDPVSLDTISRWAELGQPPLRCPAADALVSVGVPAADACIPNVMRTPSLKERRKRYSIIGKVYGRELGRAALVLWAKRRIPRPDGGLDPRLAPFLAEYDEMFPPPDER